MRNKKTSPARPVSLKNFIFAKEAATSSAEVLKISQTKRIPIFTL